MHRQEEGWKRIWAVCKSTATSGSAKEDAYRKTWTSLEMKVYGRVKVKLYFFSDMATASCSGYFTPGNRHLLNKKLGRLYSKSELFGKGKNSLYLWDSNYSFHK